MAKSKSYIDPAYASVSKKKPMSVWLILGIIIVGLVVIQLVVLAVSKVSAPVPGLSSGITIAIVPIEGMIATKGSSGFFDSGSIAASEQLVDTIKSIKEDSSVDAVVFHVNSGGGFVVPSHKIAKAVSSIGKPNVVVVEDVAASGAYWIASASDYIIADDFSMVGSIGVIASSLNFAEFIDEHNITYERLVAGKYKDMGSPFKELTPEERQKFQGQLDALHTAFIDAVAKNRGMDAEHIRELATGEVFLGNQARNLGLVDALGGMDEAEEYLLSEFGASEAYYVSYEEQPSFIDTLMYSSKSLNPLGKFSELTGNPVPQFR